jgi:bacterioferritin-associated ferredoxin
MWVCHCVGVNDRQLRRVVELGARDEADIAMVCGAGSKCGGCQEDVRRVLAECGERLALPS